MPCYRSWAKITVNRPERQQDQAGLQLRFVFSAIFVVVFPMDSSATRVRTELQVMFFDTDCGGVVHNIAYLRFIEIARTLLAEKLGLPLTEMADTRRYPVVVRTEIDYRRPAKLGDRVVIEGWLDRVERVRFWCGFRIVRPNDETLIADCRQMLALIEMPAGKLLRLPEDWGKYRTSPDAVSSDSRDVPFNR